MAPAASRGRQTQPIVRNASNTSSFDQAREKRERAAELKQKGKLRRQQSEQRRLQNSPLESLVQLGAPGYDTEGSERTTIHTTSEMTSGMITPKSSALTMVTAGLWHSVWRAALSEVGMSDSAADGGRGDGRPEEEEEPAPKGDTQLSRAQEYFSMLDSNKDGLISRMDVKRFLQPALMMDAPLLRRKVQTIYELLDTKKNGKIDWPAFQATFTASKEARTVIIAECKAAAKATQDAAGLSFNAGTATPHTGMEHSASAPAIQKQGSMGVTGSMIMAGRKRHVSLNSTAESTMRPKGAGKNMTLHDAAVSGDTDRIRMLLAVHKMQVDGRDIRDRTALMVAAEANKLDAAQLLLGQGASLSAIDSRGRSALHRATAQGNVDMARMFMDAGANIELKDDKGDAPFTLHPRHVQEGVHLIIDAKRKRLWKGSVRISMRRKDKHVSFDHKAKDKKSSGKPAPGQMQHSKSQFMKLGKKERHELMFKSRMKESNLSIDQAKHHEAVKSGLLRGLQHRQRLAQGSITWMTDNKVGGHDFLVVHIDGEETRYILKPLQSKGRGLRETSVFEAVAQKSESSSEAHDFAQWIPGYFGIVHIGRYLWIVMEDICEYFKKANVLDVKVGYKTYMADAIRTKKMAEMLKYPHQRTLGFRVTGMQIHGKKPNGQPDLVVLDQTYGRSLTPKTIDSAFVKFFKLGQEKGLAEGSERGGKAAGASTAPKQMTTKSALILASVMDKLQKLERFLKSSGLEDEFSLVAASILFVYQRDPMKVEVRLIDFGNTRMDIGADGNNGVAYGATTLMSIIRRISASHARHKSEGTNLKKNVRASRRMSMPNANIKRRISMMI